MLQGVPQGSYRVQWRMRISLSARWNEPLDFTVSVMEVYINIKAVVAYNMQQLISLF